MPWSSLLVVLIVSLVLSAVGYIKYVYFLSIGYGLSVAGGGIAILVLTLINGWVTGPALIICIIQVVLFCIYGIRLSGFLLIREMKNAMYKKVLAEATKTEKKMPVFVLIAMWISVAVLYTAQVSPVLFRVSNQSTDLIVPIIGISISVIGILLETIADLQKTAQKKERPDMVATKGLYKMCRCPNYFGEIVFWVGVFVAGITTYANVAQWIVAVLALICIVYIMFNGAQRLEKRQLGRYGDNPEYKEYADKTPIIIPIIPVYHLVKQTKQEK